MIRTLIISSLFTLATTPAMAQTTDESSDSFLETLQKDIAAEQQNAPFLDISELDSPQPTQPPTTATQNQAIQTLSNRITQLEQQQSRFACISALLRLEQRARTGLPYRTEWVQLRSLWLHMSPQTTELTWLEPVELSATSGLPSTADLLSELHSHKHLWLAQLKNDQTDTSILTNIKQWLTRHIRLTNNSPDASNIIASHFQQLDNYISQLQWAHIPPLLEALSQEPNAPTSLQDWINTLQLRMNAEQALQTSWSQLLTPTIDSTNANGASIHGASTQ